MQKFNFFFHLSINRILNFFEQSLSTISIMLRLALQAPLMLPKQSLNCLAFLIISSGHHSPESTKNRKYLSVCL
jgi:hypothetical protein